MVAGKVRREGLGELLLSELQAIVIQYVVSGIDGTADGPLQEVVLLLGEVSEIHRVCAVY